MIRAALGDATSVVNIGAGSGSYEPTDLAVVPVEPSELMIRQRPLSLPPAVRGVAEALPLPDKSIDAALAVLTAHHWAYRPAAFAEIRRVARRRAVFFTHDPDATFGWLDDYFPGLAGDTTSRYPQLVEFEVLGRVTIEPVPMPANCTTASPPPTGADRTPMLTKPYGRTCQPSPCSTVGSWPTVSLGLSAISPIAPGTAATPHC